MIYKFITQRFHVAAPLWTGSSLIGKLRKKTHYPIIHCRKALEANGNDLLKAEAWLNENAQSLGLLKANILQARKTAQGLVGVLVRNKTAALVEINCETDFVAKNDLFLNLVKTATNACAEYGEQHTSNSYPLRKISFNTEQLKDIKHDGKSLADHLALLIGSVGENATLKRATCFSAGYDIHLSGFAHPNNNSDGLLCGRFGGILALKQTKEADVDINDIGVKLCQHIVGMDPKKIGNPDVDKRNNSIDDEDVFLYQEYLHDDSVLVKDVLEDSGLQVIDFKRYACGDDEQVSETLENVETCQ